MNNKINIAEILKDCPKGTKLFSLIEGEVTFNGIDDNNNEYSILILDTFKRQKSYTKEGYLINGYPNAECVLFPSSRMRDWSYFFKRGDVLIKRGGGMAVAFVKDHLAILKEHLDVKKTKNVLMFIVTNSPIIVTDVLGENVLFFNLSASETTYYSKRKTFNGNIIDVISKYRVSGINAEISSQIVSSIIKQCNQNKSIPKEEIDSIGDEFIYNYIQNCSAYNPK